jgi:GxxExxY protein
VRLPYGYRIDLLVAGLLVVEIKSVIGIEIVHEAQLLTYMRLSGCPVGLLINFNVATLREGIRRRQL